MLRFDLTDLRLFVCVADAGSITRGARRTCLALASASARLARLESALDAQLLVRGARGVTVTAEGAIFLRHARAILAQIGQMEAELAVRGRPLSGQVRVMSNTSALSEFLPAALQRFLRRHPAVSIDIEERRSSDIVRRLALGHADLGIVADSVSHRALETHAFRDDPLVVALPAGHALSGRRDTTLGALSGAALVGLTEDSPLQQHIEQHARRAGVALACRVRVRTLEAACELVQAGIGAAIVPRATLQRLPVPVGSVPLAERWARRRLVIATRRDGALTAAARALVAHLAHAGPAGG